MILLMTTARITMNLILPVTAQILQTAAILLAVIRSLILLRIPVMGSGDTSGGDTSGGDAPAIPDYTETPGDGYEPSEDNNWDYVAPGADSGADGSDGSDSAQPDMEVYE